MVSNPSLGLSCQVVRVSEVTVVVYFHFNCSLPWSSKKLTEFLKILYRASVVVCYRESCDRSAFACSFVLLTAVSRGRVAERGVMCCC